MNFTTVTIQTARGPSEVRYNVAAGEEENRILIRLTDGQPKGGPTIEEGFVLNKAVSLVAKSLYHSGVTIDQIEWSYQDPKGHLRGIDVTEFEVGVGIGHDIDVPEEDRRAYIEEHGDQKERTHVATLEPRPKGYQDDQPFGEVGFRGEAKLYDMSAMYEKEVKALFQREAEKKPDIAPNRSLKPPVEPGL